MSDDERDHLLRAAAQVRQRNYASTRLFTPDHDLVGIAGENAFARDFRLHHDLTNRPKGDGGIDFWVPLMFSIDVKASPTPGHLLVEVGKVVADIYVLARGASDDLLGGSCLGWEWKDGVLAAPQRIWHGVLNHDIERAQLRPMDELRRRLVIAGVFAGFTP